jgi:hypothetical protein
MASQELKWGEPIALGNGRQAIPIAAVSRSTTANRSTIRVAPWAIDLRDGEHVHRMRIHDTTTQAIGTLLVGAALATALAVWILRWVGVSRRREERNRQ